MILVLREDCELVITNKTSLSTSNSVSNSITFYIGKNIKGWDTTKCSFLINLIDLQGNVSFARLEKVSEYNDTFFMFKIRDDEDFYLNSTNYKVAIITMNYNT